MIRQRGPVDVRGEPFVTFDVSDAEFAHAETTGGHVAEKAEDDGAERRAVLRGEVKLDVVDGVVHVIVVP